MLTLIGGWKVIVIYSVKNGDTFYNFFIGIRKAMVQDIILSVKRFYPVDIKTSFLGPGKTKRLSPTGYYYFRSFFDCNVLPAASKYCKGSFILRYDRL